MSGFSLGAGHRQGGAGGDDQEAIPPDNLFLYGGSGAGGGGGSNRNEEISYTRGFELWQQHQHQQQQIQRHLYPASGGMLAFSDEAQLGGSGRSGGSAGRGSSSGGAGSVSCQDCGNQAKKDCAHLRCRTCCKSRNFQCPTHVKSTWVPASKRRERAAAAATAAAQQQQQQQTNRGAAPPGSSEPSKRPREICTRFPSTIVATSSGVGGSGMEGALSFPAEVSSPAVFRCVRVSPMDESEDEYAYQTAVSIGGHVFKGILYDQGRESNYPPSPPRSSSAAAAVAIAMGPSSSAAPATAGLLDPSSLYPAPISAFMAGTQFFPHHPRP